VATLGWLKIGVSTDTSQFAKGMKTAESALGGLKSAAMMVGGALGVGLSVAGITAFVKSSMSAIGETKGLATILGMSSEGFGRLSGAARLAGVDQETFAHSLEKMNEKLGDVATTGEGPAADALRRFGISAKSLVNAGPEKAFEQLLGVLAKIENPMERASVAVDLFGKSGQSIIKMAAKGSGGIAGMAADAGKLGVALSDVDVAKVGAANVALNRVQMAVEGIGNSLAVTLAPYIKTAADGLANFGISVVSAFNSARPALSAFFEGAIGWADTLWTGLGHLVAGVVEVKSALDQLLTDLFGVSDITTVFGAGLIVVSGLFFGLPGAIVAAVAGIVGFETSLKFVMDVIDGVGFAFRNLPEIFEIAGMQISEKVINIGEYFATLPTNLGIIADYIAGNWVELITDAVNAVGSLFQNLGVNLANLGSAIAGFFRGEGFKFDWTPLLDGFTATAAELPKLLAPELTSMQDQINAKLDAVAANELARTQKLGKGAAERTKLGAGETTASPGGMLHPKVVEPGFGGALEMGSSAAYSAIVKSKAMQGSSLEGKIESNTRLTAEATTQSAAALSRMAQMLESSKGDIFGRSMTAGN
jgi:hypothetical protein